MSKIKRPSTKMRRGKVADALALSLLAEFSFREAFVSDFKLREDLDNYCAKTFSYAKIRSSLKRETNYFILLYHGEEMVGYAKLKVAEDPVQLQKIYLHSAFTGRGLGSVLLEESKRIARSNNAKRLWLAVETRNRAAIAFYEKTNWEYRGAFDFQIGSQLFHFHRMELTL